MSALEHSEARLNILILDACRTNPFGYARSGERGLARVDAPSGSLVAFSTSPGKAASDGTGVNSPYTEALVEALGVSGLKIEEVFKTVRIKVMTATHNEQTPWESTSLMGDFYPAGQAKPGAGNEERPRPHRSAAAGPQWPCCHCRPECSRPSVQLCLREFPMRGGR